MTAVIGPSCPILRNSNERLQDAHNGTPGSIILPICLSTLFVQLATWTTLCKIRMPRVVSLANVVSQPIIHAQKGAWFSALERKTNMQAAVCKQHASSGMQAVCKQQWVKKTRILGNRCRTHIYLLYSWLSKYNSASATGPYLAGVHTNHPTPTVFFMHFVLQVG